MLRTIRLATRGSRLAMIQSEIVAELLRKSQPEVLVEYVTVMTRGDQRRDVPLAELSGTDGVFTRAVEIELLAGRADLAVHSLKDVPTLVDERLILAAFPVRGDARDVLISRSASGFDELPAGSVVATSSPRRAAQVLSERPDLRVASIRGNVDTRLGKLRAGQADALLLAGAGLARLGLADDISDWLPVERFIPAVGQGALGVQCRADDPETMGLLKSLDDPDCRTAVTAERVFLRAVGGGCRLPLAAYGWVEGERLAMLGFVAGPRGEQARRVRVVGPVDEPEAAGLALAERLLQVADPTLLAEVRGG